MRIKMEEKKHHLLELKESDLTEGIFFNRWMYSRIVDNNRNVLGVELGSTGSGKSYRDLRKAELWYDFYFHEKFPVDNICFGVADIINKLAHGNSRRGEIFIFEEAGANLGSLDFQNKISKMFTYVLQSFRSMNVAVFFNLPYLSMMNKSARMLLHYSFLSAGVDKKNKMNKCKPFFNQVNQQTGKIYQKYLKAKVDGRTKTIKRFSYSLPSEYLTKAYEEKKKKYLEELTKGYSKELALVNKENTLNGDLNLVTIKPIKVLSKREQQVYNLLKEGITNQTEIGKIINSEQPYVSRIIKNIEKKGFKYGNELVIIKEKDIHHNISVPLTVAT